MKYNTLNMAVMLAIAGIGLSTSASAQREISGQIEEVGVTAQHREQNLQMCLSRSLHWMNRQSRKYLPGI